MKLRFVLDEGGWARAWVEHDKVVMPMVVSYLSDSLGDLVRATLQVLGGGERAIFVWNREPNSYRWMFRRNSELVNVEIDEFRDVYPDGELPAADGADRFSAQVTPAELGGAVLDLMESVSPEFYNRSWEDYEFPTASVDQLRSTLGRLPNGAA